MVIRPSLIPKDKSHTLGSKMSGPVNNHAGRGESGGVEEPPPEAHHLLGPSPPPRVLMGRRTQQSWGLQPVSHPHSLKLQGEVASGSASLYSNRTPA